MSKYLMILQRFIFMCLESNSYRKRLIHSYTLWLMVNWNNTCTNRYIEYYVRNIILLGGGKLF